MREEILVFGFDDPDARFEGHLLGALETAESGGAIRIAEVLFVGREPSGELTALRLSGGSAGLVTALAEFRLGGGEERKAATERALDGLDPRVREELVSELGSGSAVAAVVIEHVWARGIADAVVRSGGRPLADEDLRARAVAAVRGAP